MYYSWRKTFFGYSGKHPPNLSMLGLSVGAELCTIINHLKSVSSFSRNLTTTSPTASWTLGLVTHYNHLCFTVEEI